MSEQPDLIKDNEVKNVDSYEFEEPIRGYPVLHWRGKRPFRSTHYFPAELKETHGDSKLYKDGAGRERDWYNQIFWGDNLQVMSHLLREFRGKVDLVYIDPPFDSKAEYKKKITLRGKSATNEHSAFEEKQYTDIWSNDEYLQYMYERLVLLRELLCETGSLYLHCDPRRSHHLRQILDEVFGPEGFQNEIVWQRTNAHNMKTKTFVRANDYILYYTRSPQFAFHINYLDYGAAQLKRYKRDKDGNLYTGQDLTFSSTNTNRQFEWRGTTPPPNRSWGRSIEELEELWTAGRILTKKDGTPRLDGLKVYLSETKGTPLTTNWNDLGRIGNTSSERTDYPTQKPEALLERILRASTNPGDIVLDCFMGSGTAQAVAMKLGRRFIGADINSGAIQTATKRLNQLRVQLGSQREQLELGENEEPQNENYTGFQVFTVNNYDIFRNPVQARDLLIKALEIEPLERGSYFDGVKDGYDVKLMPVNRIATKADVSDLIANLNYRDLNRRKKESPTQVQQRIMLVCMGHDPDLAAFFKKETEKYRIELKVYDILRDGTHLTLKYPSEAKISINKGKLKIERFYPHSLMQKLSLQKTAVKEWSELAESVMIDPYYDGTNFTPTITDIPEKNESVVGTYALPEDFGSVAVKITDLISDTHFEVVQS